MAEQRNMIFMSHAIEENEFTLWLALKLANAGYGVWCDLTKLLGGENWPREINRALQNRTQKFLFVLSRASNSKDNTLGELTTAFGVAKREKLQDFVVPLKVDDLRYDEMDFRLPNVQSISFQNGWSAGLTRLLTVLERDHIEKNAAFSPSSVNQWWKSLKYSDPLIVDESEIMQSNRYAIVKWPTSVYAHRLKNCFPIEIPGYVPYIFVPYEDCLLSFATADELRQHLDISVRDAEEIEIADISTGEDNLVQHPGSGRMILARMFNQALWKGLKNKGLRAYELANKKRCYYFHSSLLPKGTIVHLGRNELSSRIKLYGNHLSEEWYWAIRASFKTDPVWHVNMQYHVLAGRDKAGEVRPAPKGAYSRWNNRVYRDRLKAAMYHLAGDDENISFPLGNGKDLVISKTSIDFLSPVSLLEQQMQADSESFDE
jgi:hypothetical protein